MSNVNMPCDILEFMNIIEYGYCDINDNIHKSVDEYFADYYKLQSPQETLKYKIGVCWDQVELERFLFQKTNLEFKTYFIVYYDNDQCPTHTFLIYKDNNKYFWFENSWAKYKGIKSYDTELDALKDIKEKFILTELNGDCNYTNLFIYEYLKPKYGINVMNFYKHCENGNKIIVN